MTKLIALAVLASLLLAACEYQPPPGGTDAYCYRIEQERIESERGIVLFSNVEPDQQSDGTVIVHDAWFTFHSPKRGASDRYDRFAEQVSLSQHLGGIRVENRCP